MSKSHSFDFVEYLVEQIAFIKSSVESALQGNWREGLRIATAIRVVVHQTSKSTSLLTHLGCPNPEMLSTASQIPEGVVFAESGLTMMAATPKGAFVMPSLDKGPTRRLVEFHKWWDEKVYVLNEFSMTRRQLVLAAANKDGGAHVKPDEMPKNYEKLKQGLWAVGPNGREHQAMMTLVQMGFEVIHSPGINQLANIVILPLSLTDIPERPNFAERLAIMKQQVNERASRLSGSEKDDLLAIAKSLKLSQLLFLADGFSSSDNSSTYPLGNYQKGISEGETGSYNEWTELLTILCLTKPVQFKLPDGMPSNVLYSVTERSKDVVAVAFKCGLLQFT